MPDAAVNWKKLGRLKYPQWVVIAQSPIVLGMLGNSLRRRGYQETLDRIPLAPDSDLSPARQLSNAKDIAYALAVAVKFAPWRPRCLLRSLALCWFLARRGIPFDLRIGVPAGKPVAAAGSQIDFSAHAWVEHHGVVLNDRADIAAQFSAFEEPCGSGFGRDGRG